MARKHREAPPEVNAGSMADIAFLLLIFFLVTTTIQTDQGITRKLPPIQPDLVDPPPVKEKNIFTVLINRNDQLLVEDKLMDLRELRQAAIEFLDNGGDGSCSYCKGARNEASSDNPDKAIISLQNDAETSYKAYIAVQNELVAAVNEVRDELSTQKFGKKYANLTNEQKEAIRDAIPSRISEAEPKTIGGKK